MLAELIAWTVFALVAGVISYYAVPGVSRLGILGALGVALAASVAGGLAGDVLIGDVARVRVTITARNAISTVVFGLVPFLIAAVACLGALVAAGRGLGRGEA